MAEKQLKNLIELGVSNPLNDLKLVQQAIAAVAQDLARRRLQDATSAIVVDNAGTPDTVGPYIGALTDSSGGSADAEYDLVAITTPTVGVVNGVTAFSPKAGFDTAVTAIENAHIELASKVNEMLDATLGWIDSGTPTGSPVSMTGMSGTAADGTIASITVALTAATSGCVEDATGIAEINKMRNYQANIAAAINYLRVAVGLAPINDATGGVIVRNIDGWDVDDFNAAATGTAATSGQNTLTDASVDAALAAVRNNIASMAACLNAMRGNLGFGLHVVATTNPRTRLVGAFRD